VPLSPEHPTEPLNDDSTGATIEQTQTVSTTRRAPLQGRSQETVQRILDAASKLLERIPMEEITTSRIAQEGGLSVGGLYRFFPDKQSILDAIAVRHVKEFESEVRKRLLYLLPLGGKTFLNAVIDRYVEFLDARPDFRTLAFGRHISPATRAEQVRPDVGTAKLVRQVMAKFMGMKDSDELSLKIRIATEAGERLLAFAYEQGDQEERDRVIAELKTLLGRYLFG
jgi:AcrR family transcriptional regulator